MISQQEKIAELTAYELDRNRQKTNKMFERLMVGQWLFGICIAVWVSPYTWEGSNYQPHIHLYAAIILGGIISLFPILQIRFTSNQTRIGIIVAIAQMLWSSLLIHLMGGRIEAHFHVFGSLAFLSAYRDVRLLFVATAIVATDHIVRGYVWPQSLYGVLYGAEWRWIEHSIWVIFEDIFLIQMIRKSLEDMRGMSDRQVQLMETNVSVELMVEDRTRDLEEAYRILEEEIRDREKIQGELLQSEKMASVGQLAGGIAHEINTPVQYIGDNLKFLHDEQVNLFNALNDCSDTVKNDLDYEFLKEEFPNSILQSIEGIEHVANLVRSMKEFAHPGNSELKPMDINRAINNVINVSKNEWKYCADIELKLSDTLPNVPCLYGEFNQVLLNLIVNSAHAIISKQTDNDCSDKGKITVESYEESESISILISDTGCGIKPEHLKKVFDPFFTTKEVGKGTGQGLSIAFNLIQDKLGGSLSVESTLGVKTTFKISLPLKFAENLSTDELVRS